MGFDAGSIVAHMKLTTEEWEEKLEEVKAQGEEINHSELRVPVTMETEGFMEDAEEVQLVKDDLEQPIDIPVHLDDSELDAEAADALAKLEALRALASEPIDTGIGGPQGLTALPAELEAATNELESAMQDVAALSERAGGNGLVQSLLDAGVAEGELVTALRGFGFKAGEAQAMIGDAKDAAERAALEAAALRTQILQTYLTGIMDALDASPLALGTGAGGGQLMPTLDPFIAKLGEALNSETDWERLTFPSELPSWSRGLPALLSTPDWQNVSSGESLLNFAHWRMGQGPTTYFQLPASSLIGGAEETWLADEWGSLGNWHFPASGASESNIFGSFFTRTNPVLKLLGSQWSDAFAGWSTRSLLSGGVSGLSSKLQKDSAYAYRVMIDRAETLLTSGTVREGLALADAAEKTGGKLTKSAADALAKGMIDEAESDAGWATKASVSVSKVFSASDSLWSSLSSAPGGMLTNPGMLLALPELVPLVGALGTIAGGMLAGTSIGLAGTAWAAIPGVLDLMKGYSAYSDQKAAAAGTATAQKALAALPGGALSVGTAIGKLIGGGSSLVGGLEGQLYPGVTQFLLALATGLKAVAPFAQVAVGQMSAFFGVIDQGLKSAGFRSFMQTMTKDLGPIMSDFGQVIEHLGTAFGDFLKLFGGAPAQIVGAWFVRVTTDLDKFMEKIHFGPGFLAGVTTAMHGLGSVLHFLWTALVKFAEGAAPVGLNVLKALPDIFGPLGSILHAIPTTVVTALVVGFSAFLALGKVASVISGIGGALKTLVVDNPELLILAGAITAVTWALTQFHAAPRTSIGNLSTMAALAAKTPKSLTATQAAQLRAFEKQFGTSAATLRAYYEAQERAARQAQAAAAHPWSGIGPPGPPVYGPPGPASSYRPLTGRSQNLVTNVGATGRKGTWRTPVSMIHESDLERGAATWVNIFVRAWHEIDDHFVRPLTSFFTSKLPHAFGDVGSAFKSAWDTVSASASEYWDRLYAGLVSPVIRFFSQEIPHAVAGVGGSFTSAWNTITGGAESFWHSLDGNVLEPVDRFFTQTLPHAITQLPADFQAMWGKVESYGSSFFTWLGLHVGDPIVNLFTKTIPSAITKLVGFFERLPSRIGSAIGTLGGILVHAGSSLLNGLITGIDSVISWINSHDPSVFGVHLFPTLPEIPKRAMGGPASGLTLVGETGPELVNFGSQSYVTPNSTLRQLSVVGGSSASAPITIYVDARGASSPASVRQQATMGVQTMIPRLRQAMERGAA